MDLPEPTAILRATLSDCYFIYMGEDNKDYPVLEMLKHQCVFSASTFVSRKPILEGEKVFHSKETWQAIIKSKNKKYVLIFADLKVHDYFFELLDICKRIGYPNDKIFVITANDYEYVDNELTTLYSEFAKNHYVAGPFIWDDVESLQKGLGYVLSQIDIEYDTPTIQTLCDDLEWEFVLKDMYKQWKEKENS